MMLNTIPPTRQTIRITKYAALLLVLCSFFEAKPVSAQADIRLIGFQYPEQLKHYAQQCLSFLEVDRNILITIIRSTTLARPYEGQTIKAEVDTSGRDQFIIYLLAGLNSAKESLVLAHELIHVKQYVSRRLEIKGDKIFWLGRKFHLKEESAFYPPWENEAHAADHKLARNFAMSPRKAKKSMSKLIAKNCDGSTQAVVYP